MKLVLHIFEKSAWFLRFFKNDCKSYFITIAYTKKQNIKNKAGKAHAIPA